MVIPPFGFILRNVAFFGEGCLINFKERPNDDIEKLLDITFGIVRGLWSFFELWERLLPSKILRPFKDNLSFFGGDESVVANSFGPSVTIKSMNIYEHLAKWHSSAVFLVDITIPFS